MRAAILREARGWLAVAKPSGIPTIPGRGEDAAASLWRTLERARGERLWVVHRLDRDTSGIVLFARSAVAHRELCGAFARAAIRKTYLAFVRGVPDPEEGSITSALHAARKGKMRPARDREPGALVARTDYALAGRWETPYGTVALVEVFPRTGRQHQIRVHLRSAGTPLLVDPLYARSSSWPPASPGTGGEPWVRRLTLHAWRVAFEDPDTGSGTTLEAPLPPDLAALRAALDRV